MTFVTRLRFTSGDRAALDRVVDDVRDRARRKGVQFKGPHSDPPETYQVPQHGDVDDPRRFDPWAYTVYQRRVEIVGYQEFARSVAGQEFPASLHIEVEVERT